MEKIISNSKTKQKFVQMMTNLYWPIQGQILCLQYLKILGTIYTLMQILL